MRELAKLVDAVFYALFMAIAIVLYYNDELGKATFSL